MAARKAATVRPQEYEDGVGWDVGQKAPADAFRAYDREGAVTGPVVHTHPGGAARQIVIKGAVVTEGVKRELDAAADDSAAEDEQG